ncbi:MAG: PepSY-associated TM helix domain-containing protein [Bacteroidota bacterium]
MTEPIIQAAKHKDPKKAKKKIAKISRWLHIYLSMVSFAIVLFFSVTGLTLNHPDFFAGKTITTQDKGKLTASWVNPKDTNLVAKLNVVEFFRNTHHVKGAVSEFRIEESQISVSFRGPGYAGDVFVTRETGEYELSQTRSGLVGFMNDLHKGRDTGKTWSWVIDISAILLVLISVTGLVLLLFLKKKRSNGLWLALAGLILIYIIYKLWGQ